MSRTQHERYIFWIQREAQKAGPSNMSAISIRGNGMTVRIEVRLDHTRPGSGAWAKRTLMLAIFRRLKPILAHLKATLRHPSHICDDRRQKLYPPLPDKGHDLLDRYARIGFEFRMRRLKAGLTLKQLSARSGLTIDQLSRLERGTREARWSTLRRLEDAIHNPQKETPQ
jgi:hypothetical protein